MSKLLNQMYSKLFSYVGTSILMNFILNLVLKCTFNYTNYYSVGVCTFSKYPVLHTYEQPGYIERESAIGDKVL